MDYAKESLRLHGEWKGKIEMVTRVPVKTKDDLSLAYTPGVAQPCLEIQTTASANSTANITSVMIPRSVIFIPRFLLYGFLPQVYTIYRQRATACRTFFVQGAADAAARRECCTPGGRRTIFAAGESVSRKVK